MIEKIEEIFQKLFSERNFLTFQFSFTIFPNLIFLFFDFEKKLHWPTGHEEHWWKRTLVNFHWPGGH